ncbi:MAG TPA: efflux RND transporter periplasmic adaptor subunit [Thermoanaerobaculia bacterium]|nr:efflux RND transporter periplasmic adaptor subunit [Thermoanaerobaculia bacterium]
MKASKSFFARLAVLAMLLTGCGDGFVGEVKLVRPDETTPATAPAAPATPAAARPPGYVGVVVAAETADLAFDIRGRLTQVAVRPGDHVRPGMPLATIEPLDLREQLVSAEASVQMARSGVSQAETALRLARERVTRVHAAPEVFSEEERSVAKGNLETAEKDLETARARVTQADAELRRLRGQSYRQVLRSPTEGWVAARLLDPGALVEPGQPVVRLKRGDRYLLRFAVPPAEAPQWKAGRPIRWRPESLDRSFRAEVARVAQQVDLPSQMVFVEADLDPSETEGLLKDGLVVRVEPWTEGP